MPLLGLYTHQKKVIAIKSDRCNLVLFFFFFEPPPRSRTNPKYDVTLATYVLVMLPKSKKSYQYLLRLIW